MSIHNVRKYEGLNKDTQELFLKTYEWTNQCIQCGYCLPACPTYATMGKESASPRGRINLVKMAAEGRLDIQRHLTKPINLCLGCRACEVECPVGVPYGNILEAAKEVIVQFEPFEQKQKVNRVKNLTLTHLFPYQKRLNILGNFFWLYQKGLNQIIRKTKLINKLSEPLAQFEKVLPSIESPLKRIKRGSIFPPENEKKIRVAFFSGCIMDAVMSRINRLTIKLLQAVGCEVIVPLEQNCCGAIHAHQGEIEQAKFLAKANIVAFEKSGADVIVNNAGGCGAQLIEYDRLFADDKDWRERAKGFVKHSKDISVILSQYGPLPFKHEWKGTVIYQDSCHLRNVQGVYQEPRQLLQSIPGVMFKELDGANRCCASGGIYNLLNYQDSMVILDEKMKKVHETNASAVITSNPGCHLQMSLGIKKSGMEQQMRSMHLVEILAEACGFK